jgi:hypothetical protein
VQLALASIANSLAKLMSNLLPFSLDSRHLINKALGVGSKFMPTFFGEQDG